MLRKKDRQTDRVRQMKREEMVSKFIYNIFFQLDVNRKTEKYKQRSCMKVEETLLHQ